MSQETAFATQSITVSQYFRATAVIESAKAANVTVSVKGEGLQVGPRSWVTEDLRTRIREHKGAIIRVLTEPEPEWTADECKAVVDEVVQRHWLFAPSDWVESQWPEMKTDPSWYRHWNLFPFGWRQLASPLAVLYDLLDKNGGGDADDRRHLLKLAVTKPWHLMRVAYRQAFVSDDAPY